MNAISNYAVMCTRGAVMFFLTPFLIRTLGKESYGIWVLVMSLVGYAGILDLGVSRALQRYVARHAGRGDTDAVNRTLGTAMLFFGVAGAFGGCVLGACSGLFAEWLNVPSDQRGVFRGVMWVAGLNCMLGMIAGVVKQALKAREAFVAANIVMIFAQLAMAVMTILAVQTGKGLQGVAIGMAISTAISVVAFYLWTRRRFPETRLSPTQFQWGVLRPMLGFGLFAVIWVVADQLRFRVAPVIVGRYVAVEAIAVFAVGAMIVNQIGLLFVMACEALGPRFASLDGRGATADFEELFLRASRLSSLLAAVAFGVAILAGDGILRLWIGGGTEESYEVLLILAFGYSVGRAQSVAYPMLFAKAKHRVFALIMLAEGAVNVVLSYLLVRWWGLSGVALGAAIPMTIVALGFLPVYACRAAGVPLGLYMNQVVLRQVGAIVLVYGAHAISKRFFMGSALSLATGGSVWLVVLGVLFNREVKDLIEIVGKRFGGAKARLAVGTNRG